MAAREALPPGGNESYYKNHLEQVVKENTQLKQKLDQLERENRDLKHSVYELNCRRAALQRTVINRMSRPHVYWTGHIRSAMIGSGFGSWVGVVRTVLLWSHSMGTNARKAGSKHFNLDSVFPSGASATAASVSDAASYTKEISEEAMPNTSDNTGVSQGQSLKCNRSIVTIESVVKGHTHSGPECGVAAAYA